VQRQVTIVGDKLVSALPKGRKLREVPLSSRVRDVLSAHLSAYPPHRDLSWGTHVGAPVEARLFLTSRESAPLNRNYINRNV